MNPVALRLRDFLVSGNAAWLQLTNISYLLISTVDDLSNTNGARWGRGCSNNVAVGGALSLTGKAYIEVRRRFAGV